MVRKMNKLHRQREVWGRMFQGEGRMSEDWNKRMHGLVKNLKKICLECSSRITMAEQAGAAHASLVGSVKELS